VARAEAGHAEKRRPVRLRKALSDLIRGFVFYFSRYRGDNVSFGGDAEIAIFIEADGNALKRKASPLNNPNETRSENFSCS
jgi:hypothetical protein